MYAVCSVVALAGFKVSCFAECRVCQEFWVWQEGTGTWISSSDAEKNRIDKHRLAGGRTPPAFHVHRNQDQKPHLKGGKVTDP